MNYKKLKWGVEKIAFPCFYNFAFFSQTDRPTDNIFIEYMLIYERCAQKKLNSISTRDRETRIFFHFCLLWPDRQTDGQNIYRIDAHTNTNLNHKLNQGPRKSRFPLNLTDGHMDRRMDISDYRVALLLKMDKNSLFVPVKIILLIP